MYEYSCEVQRVVDGDTVDVVLDLGFDVRFFSRVRLYGIDTPESRTRNRDEKVRGLLSKDYLVNAIADKDVVIKTKLKDSRGKFGRVLGEVWVGRKNINKQMVKENHAVEYFGQSKDDIQAAHDENRAALIARGAFNPDDV
jgi:micrococcal nuclease